MATLSSAEATRPIKPWCPAARHKISFSISKRRYSCPNRTNSDCSALVIPSLTPSSMSAWRIRQRTDSSATPKSVATSGILRSPRRATASGSLMNSSAYRFHITMSSPQARKPTQRESSQPTSIPLRSSFRSVEPQCFDPVTRNVRCVVHR